MTASASVPVPVRRIVLWTVLVAVLLGVAVAAGWSRWRRAPPPPVLGQVPPFSLVNRDGRTVTGATLAGSPWVADFVFTRCAASCPMMTARMARLNRELPSEAPGKTIHLVSISVDPDHDTPPVLAQYAASFQAPARWLFLTGPAPEIHRLSRDGFKLAVDVPPGEAPEAILHSTRFVLVDGEGRIRGYYDGFDEAAMGRLVRDLKSL